MEGEESGNMNQSLKNLVCEEKRGKGLVPNEDMG